MDIKFLSKLAKNPKVQIISLLFLLFIVALSKFSPDGYNTLIIQLGIAIITAIFAELAFFGFVKAMSLHSAIISGMLIGLLLVPGVEFIVIWFAVTCAIASKILFRFPSGKHIFNPAACGLIFTTIFFGNQLNWWGFPNPYLVIILGGIILYRMNRLSLVFSYLIFRIAALCIFNGMHMTTQLLLLPNLFFAFIMLVEPKTSPGKRSSQWIFGGLTGILATLLFTFNPSWDGDLTALLILNFSKPILEKINNLFSKRNVFINDPS